MSREPDLLSCCANLYDRPLVHWLLGDSLHPGGLVLTGKLAHLLELGSDDRVLDIGSGRGATVVHLARTVGCSMTGVTLEEGGVATGRELARREGVSDRVLFLHGDFREVALRDGSFDVVVMECVLSILRDKEGQQYI